MTKKKITKTLGELGENIDEKIEKRVSTIEESQTVIDGKQAYRLKLEASLVDAEEAYRQKVKNIHTMIETAENGIKKEEARIAEREKNLEALLKLKDKYDKEYSVLEAARLEEVEVKDDMTKGVKDFIVVANKIAEAKKRLRAVSDTAGSIYYGRA